VSSRTSDHPSLAATLRDPWALAIAVSSGAVTARLGWGVPVAVLAVAAVVAVRVAAGHLIRTDAAVAEADHLADQEREVRRTLAASVAGAHGRVPAEVEERLAAIQHLILDILDVTGPAARSELYVLLRTATDYLPTALDTYLRLPQGYATTRRAVGGRTALELLVEQLDLLHTEMTEVADAVSRNDLDRLAAHGRFLTTRFGRSELALAAGEEAHR
jgi:hypothetical protein